MSRKNTILAVLLLFLSFAAVLGIRLAALSGQHGLTVRTDREVSHEQMMTPGWKRSSSSLRKLAEGETVNINTADSTLLQAVPGIGPTTAEAIIAFREEHGPYESIDDLARVPGISDSRFDQIRAYLSVEEDSP